MQHDHLLVIRFSALGDVAMTVPVIWALARQYPEVRITVLSRPFARSFFENLAPNVNFMSADLKSEYHGVKGLNALYRRLTAKQFTAVADLHNVLRSGYLRLRFHLGHYRVEHLNKHRYQRRMLVARQPRKVLQPLSTPFENYLDVFARLGYPIDPSNLCFKSLSFPETPEHTAILQHTILQSPCVGIAPFAAHRGKTYPPKLMEKVISQLIQAHPEARIILFGRGQQEDEFFAQCTAKWSNCITASSIAKDMNQELLLMSKLKVMVSMDSSNMHLASLVGIPVVSIWGATHPYAGFMGWGQSVDNSLQVSSLDCRPCSIYGNKPCLRGDYACLCGIAPERVVEKIVEFV